MTCNIITSPVTRPCPPSCMVTPLTMRQLNSKCHCRQTALAACLLAVAGFVFYVYHFTAIPVYVLDQLNLRPFFLPNILCDRCNNFSVPYVIANEKLCAGVDTVDLLILILSYQPHADARRAIRATWGGIRTYRGRNIRTVFAFGVHTDANFNHQVALEQQQYGDILQGDFAESYDSLTNKTMMALLWTLKHCANAKYVLKTDDDSFNVPQRYLDYLAGVTEPRFVGGYCFTVYPDRRVSSKYYVSTQTYPDTYFPTYCAGPGYVLSMGAIVELVAVAPNVQYLPMEDVYTAGMCRVAASIRYVQIPGTVISRDAMTLCALATWAKSAHNVVPGNAITLWEKVVKADRTTDCVGRNFRIFVVFLIGAAVWCKILWNLRHN